VETDRRRQILEAAFALLDEGGLDGVTVRAVLRRARLSRRFFYDCYAGKDALMLAVFEISIRQAVRLFEAAADAHSDPMERLERIVTAIVSGTGVGLAGGPRNGNRRSAALSREHMRLAEARPRDLEAALQPLLDLLARELAAGMSAGRFERGDPHRLAALIYNLVSTTVHTELLAKEHVEWDAGQRAQLGRDVWLFCKRAVAA